MATLNKKEFEAALATVDPDEFEDHNWLWRVNTWEKVNEMGAHFAAYSRDPEVAAVARPIAPAFFDYLMAVFPPSGDAAVFRAIEEAEAQHIAEGNRLLGR